MPAPDLHAVAPAGPVDFRQMAEEADVGICVVQDGLLQYVNRKFAQMHGWAAEELVGTDDLRLVPPDARTRIREIRQLCVNGLRPAPYVSRGLRRDGSIFDARVVSRDIVYRGRTATLTTLSDITDLARLQRVAGWRARMLVSHELLCRSGSIEIVQNRAEVRLSAGARSLLQASPQVSQVPLRQVLRAIPPEDRTHVLRQWRHAIPGQPFEIQHRLRRTDGSELRVLHHGLVDSAGGPVRGRPIAMLRDITEQASAQDRIERLVNYHPVTGLATRALLLERTANAAEAALRENRPLAMLYLRVPDVDRLHTTMGVASADALARTLAVRLVATCRAKDTVAHLGGGEFAIQLEPARGLDASHALHTATRILATLAAPATLDRAEFVAEGQIGMALFPADAANPAELLDHAHTACGHGGVGINFFTREMGESAARRNLLDTALRQAFERKELTLHYQPQVDLRDGTIVAVEALLRWNSEAFGQVSPPEFVPIAEERGLIVPLGEWVFRTACEQSVAWARAGLPPVRIAVNLSPRQLEQPDISRRLQTMLLETGADPAHLGIEVTESVLMRDLEHARRTLNELSAIGMEISLDDFGTGYSNLSVLRALPFNVLKIDRSLVHDVTASAADVSITRSMLMLAQGMKLKVLAEGVETEGQLQLLISNGCDLMQGYIFSRPLPPAELEQWLRNGTRLPDRYLTGTQPRSDSPPREPSADVFCHTDSKCDHRRLATEVCNVKLELAQAQERHRLALAQQGERLDLEAMRADTAQNLVESLPTATIGIDTDGTIVLVNRQARQMLSAVPPLVGCRADDALPPDALSTWQRRDGRHRLGRFGGRICLLSCCTMNDDHGKPRGQLLTVIPMPDIVGELSA